MGWGLRFLFLCFYLVDRNVLLVWHGRKLRLTVWKHECDDWVLSVFLALSLSHTHKRTHTHTHTQTHAHCWRETRMYNQNQENSRSEAHDLIDCKLGCRMQGSGCRVEGAGCRVQGSGFSVQGFRGVLNGQVLRVGHGRERDG